VIVLATVLAGALGAVARYVVDGVVQDHFGDAFPWGTWVVNVTGAFLLGVLTRLVLYHSLGDAPRAVLGTGLVGGYTTFSTFAYETVRLAEDGSRFEAVLNAAANTTVALAAAAAGLALASVV
jgi:CrcB protein